MNIKLETINLILKIALAVFLFLVPIALTLQLWLSPELSRVLPVIGLSTVNLVLSIAEVLFLVKAVIFPKDGKKWWREI